MLASYGREQLGVIAIAKGRVAVVVQTVEICRWWRCGEVVDCIYLHWVRIIRQ